MFSCRDLSQKGNGCHLPVSSARSLPVTLKLPPPHEPLHTVKLTPRPQVPGAPARFPLPFSSCGRHNEVILGQIHVAAIQPNGHRIGAGVPLSVDGRSGHVSQHRDVCLDLPPGRMVPR
jgi:hypothetical protein